MTRHIIGGCFCGAVRYEANAEPELTLFCHCIQFQKESGGSKSLIVHGGTRILSLQKD
jgi:hypothetical protein